MNLLYLITKSEVGGAQTHVWQLIQEEARRGNKVSLMSAPGGWLEDQCKSYGISFYPNPYFKNSYNVLNLFQALSLVRRRVKMVRPDVLHCHSGGGGFYGRLGTFGLSVKRVFTAHGWSFRPGVPLVQRLISWVAELAMRPLTHTTICVSKYDYKLGKKSGVVNPKKTFVVHNGVSLPDLPPVKKQNLKTTILFAGRLAKPKRQDIFIRSLARLPEDVRSNISVRIAGDGPQREYLEQLAQSLHLDHCVDFVFPKQGMHEEYLNADIVILLSDYEAFPMVLLEALSYRVPVIASSVGGVPEVVNETNGVLLSQTNERTVTSALLDLITSEEKRSRLGEAGRLLIQSHFLNTKMFERTHELYQRLVSEDNLNSFQKDS